MEWTTIESASTRESAEIVADALRQQGFEVQVVGDEAGGMAPHFELGTTGVDVQVPADQAEAARGVVARGGPA